MIEVSNLEYRYGSFVAVNNISFKAASGQIIGLLGRNGAGKTTTLKMLSGFLEPYRGQIMIDNLDMAKHCHSIQRRIGYLPETPPLYPEMTVIDYLRFIAEQREILGKNLKPALQSAIAKTELGDRLYQRIQTLSKGFKQRVGVAQAILHKPKLLILDEPTSGLDPAQIVKMRELIRALSDQATIVISTHILQEVEAICDRAIIIDQGKIVKDTDFNLTAQIQEVLLKVEDSADLDPIFENMRAIEKVQKAQFGLGEYTLTINQEYQEFIPDLLNQLHLAKYRVFSVSPKEKSLEEIFRQVL